eukprot:TRINITY_DN20495_c0_g1_i1.p1 TRINITY_DN20495_c0_g1~~TRINITY_DN20495_c0_g1_i1.p1  ORF type:complete len:182 (+),score=37.74 TRINITY_DN20495_c0_g1_i1:236-781(+)
MAVKDAEISSLREQLRRMSEAKWEGSVKHETLAAELHALRGNSEMNRYPASGPGESQQVGQLQAKIAKMDKYRAKLEGSLADALYELKDKKHEVERLTRTISALIDKAEISERVDKDTRLTAYRPGIPTSLDAEVSEPKSARSREERRSPSAKGSPARGRRPAGSQPKQPAAGGRRVRFGS